jgi:indole-3-glycerol phosphate synthase
MQGSARGAVLHEIVAARRQQIAEARARVPLETVQQSAERRHERRDFAGALAADGAPGLPRVIAELKQASPSAGLLRANYRPREIAQSYEAAGAAALSVLTEERFFAGSLTDLIDARDAVGLPVLRKDFIVDEYQVYESVAAGADALLLIVAALSEERVRDFVELSDRLRIDALVEVHTANELDHALAAGARLIGVNNRNLKTLEVRLETSLRLRERIPQGCVAISESGIKTASDLQKLGAAGYQAVLVGEQLMKAADPGRELAEMLLHAQEK